MQGLFNILMVVGAYEKKAEQISEIEMLAMLASPV